MDLRACLLLVLTPGCVALGPGSADGTRRDLETIARLEDARWDGEGELQRLAEHRDVEVRARAVRALGRLRFPEDGPEITRALIARLLDEAPRIRAEAAFALGMRGDASAADRLVFVALDHHEADRDGQVRARAIEALSKLDRPEFHERLLEALDDADARVRVEAAQGASRWSAGAPNAAAVNRRLLSRLAAETDRAAVTCLLSSLERRRAPEALEAFARFSTSADDEQRIFAVRGLRAHVALPEALGHLWRASTDRDWRVASEAVLALGHSAHAGSLDYLAAAARHSDVRVRRCAWESIGAAVERDASAAPELSRRGVEVLDLLASARSDESAWVRAARVEAGLRALSTAREGASAVHRDARVSALRTSLLEREPAVVRIGAARGLGSIQSGAAQAALLELLEDPQVGVREAAIEALAKHPGPTARRALLELLGDEDNGVRLAAVQSLSEMLEAADVAALARCYDSTRGDGAPEVRFNAIGAVQRLEGQDAIALVRRALVDDDAFVRRTAREAFAKLAADAPGARALLEASRLHRSAAELARRSAAVRVRAHRSPPFVEMVTARGSLLFELFPDEAPLHVENFLALAERGDYDGLDFHRVVPDFVVQGGCHRGDGNGGGTWRGRADALRHEISPRKYVRGSLGMPRYDDIDSGGRQLFVTHRATPHLDGRYTIFGELRKGFEVLDALEVGDRILAVRAAPGSEPRESSPAAAGAR